MGIVWVGKTRAIEHHGKEILSIGTVVAKPFSTTIVDDPPSLQQALLRGTHRQIIPNLRPKHSARDPDGGFLTVDAKRSATPTTASEHHVGTH